MNILKGWEKRANKMRKNLGLSNRSRIDQMIALQENRETAYQIRNHFRDADYNFSTGDFVADAFLETQVKTNIERFIIK